MKIRDKLVKSVAPFFEDSFRKLEGQEGQVYFVGICIFAKIIERKKGYDYRVVLLLWSRRCEGMLRK